VVTGANGGLGLETARALAVKGAHVVMAVRNQQKAAAAAAGIRAGALHASLELVALDLAFLRKLGMDTAIAALWQVSERETGLPIHVRTATA
jgi:NAD(P)-dependent dehydrogenase (short-subunit alcohol dehydrogenase family)